MAKQNRKNNHQPTLFKPSGIEIKTLQDAYISVTKDGGLIDFVKQLRDAGDEKLTHNQMIQLFEGLPDWEKPKKRSGHVDFKNKVTGFKIGFSGHKNDGTLNAPEKKDYLNIVQEHINILGNTIFSYSQYNWKTVPDYRQAQRNYTAWKSAQSDDNCENGSASLANT